MGISSYSTKQSVPSARPPQSSRPATPSPWSDIARCSRAAAAALASSRTYLWLPRRPAGGVYYLVSLLWVLGKPDAVPCAVQATSNTKEELGGVRFDCVLWLTDALGTDRIQGAIVWGSHQRPPAFRGRPLIHWDAW